MVHVRVVDQTDPDEFWDFDLEPPHTLVSDLRVAVAQVANVRPERVISFNLISGPYA